MSTHRPHPDSHDFGLADDCERCAEHAANPTATLDGANLRKLVFRATDPSLPARSENEATAIANLTGALDAVGRMCQISPELVVEFLRDRYRVPLVVEER